LKFPRHIVGDLCEAIAVKELTARGYTVFTTTQAHSPIDIIAVAPGGEMLYLDVKADRFRVNPNRTKRSRIHRKRSDQQKLLGVRMCYVNEHTEELHITAA
jgi:Holliday junction resolvase-like predicted endonuclease